MSPGLSAEGAVFRFTFCISCRRFRPNCWSLVAQKILEKNGNWKQSCARSNRRGSLRQKFRNAGAGTVVQVLHQAGLPNSGVELNFSNSMEPRDSETILDQAIANRCHTIVLGHASHSCVRVSWSPFGGRTPPPCQSDYHLGSSSSNGS